MKVDARKIFGPLAEEGTSIDVIKPPISRPIWGWRLNDVDFTSRGGRFQWAYPGNWTAPEDSDKPFTKYDACPLHPGDGLCIAKDLSGATSGGQAVSGSVLIVAYRKGDILGEDSHKVRVKQAFVAGVTTFKKVAIHTGADLRSANLYGAKGDIYTSLPTGYKVSTSGLIVKEA